MDVYVHIGTDKTGTSSIQQQLASNRDMLARHGILFPRSPGNARHQQLGFFIKRAEELQRMPNWRRGIGTKQTPRQFRQRFRKRLLEEIASVDPTSVIFSDEALYSAPDAALARLGGLLTGLAAQVHVVVYLRRQDDHLNSRYQQIVRTGETETLIHFADRDRRRIYDYAARLQTFQDVLRPTSIRVRPFERSSFPEGSLSLDFLRTVDAEHVHPELVPLQRHFNTSLDADAVEFLRLVNLLQVRDNGIDNALVDHRTDVAILSEGLNGPSLALPTDRQDSLMDQWADSNAEVARAHLGRNDGVLFREQRKSRNSTTRQHLSLDQAERILDLLEWRPEDRARFLKVRAADYDAT